MMLTRAKRAAGSVLAGCVVVVCSLLCAVEIGAQPANFAGKWRGVSSGAETRGMDVDMSDQPMINVEIEQRQGRFHLVRITASDQKFAGDAEEMTGYLAGELSPHDSGALRTRRVVEEITTGDGVVRVIGDCTFHLLAGETRLRMNLKIYPEGAESVMLSAWWEFQRIGPAPAPPSAAGEQGEFIVYRPTFHDALKVPAEGRQVTSIKPLQQGAMYRIRVEGSINLAPAIRGRWVVADAAFVYHAEERSSFFGRTPLRAEVLLFNDRAFNPVQDFNPSTHIYTMDIQGEGRPLTFVVADTAPEDNAGTLDVRIYRLRPDVLQAGRPSSIDPTLASVDGMIDAGRFAEALGALRAVRSVPGDNRNRERLYQLIGVLEFVTSRPLDPEEVPKDVVMDGLNLIGRALRFDGKWPSAMNNMAVWQAWNGNVGPTPTAAAQSGNALSRLEEAQRIAPDNAVIRRNLTQIRAELREDQSSASRR